MSRRRAIPCSGLCAALVAGCVSVASAQTLPAGGLILPDAAAVAGTSDETGQAARATSPRAESAVPGFDDLLTSLGRDMVQLPRRENLWLVGIGSTAAFAAGRADGAIADAAWGGGALHDFLQPGEIVGGLYAQTGGAIATYAIGRVTGSDRATQVGAELVRAQVLTQATTQFVKVMTFRHRPDGTLLSFPSGHAGGSFATATVLQRNFGWKVGVPAYAVAAWVAASRVQMKRHHLSDVIAGATVGMLAGRAVTVGKGDNTFAVTPTVVPGGAGVSFTRINR